MLWINRDGVCCSSVARCLRFILILWCEHRTLTLAAVEPMACAISKDELPFSAMSRMRAMFCGVKTRQYLGKAA
jgi:hypothetical protein